MKSELKRYWFRAKEKVKNWRSNDPLMIAPYLSYANEKEIIIRGRVLENEGIVVHEDDGKWENFVNSIKRMESDEAETTQVLVRFQDKEYSCVTNDEGFFRIIIPADFQSTQTDDLEWASAQLSLPDSEDNTNTEVEILLPHTNTKFAIITDMDDTILQSHVNSFLKLRLLYETFLKNAHSRLAFENIGNVLNKVSRNRKNQLINPIFYLSHSPWNLYELLEQFLSENDIPIGPFFLRDFGYKKGQEKYEFENHKALTIEHLFSFYPDINFILIGDATERDIDIYIEAYLKHPDRIHKIIIRATEKEEKNNHVKEMMAKHSNAPIHLIEHSDEILEIMKFNN